MIDAWKTMKVPDELLTFLCVLMNYDKKELMSSINEFHVNDDDEISGPIAACKKTALNQPRSENLNLFSMFSISWSIMVSAEHPSI
jgi:hypothetical protein